MIAFDASAVVSAALRGDNVSEQAPLRVEATDVFALSPEIANVLERPRFATAASAARRTRILDVLQGGLVWFTSSKRVADCRDENDNKCLELALASSAWATVSGDADLLVLHPWRGVRNLWPSDYLADVTGGARPDPSEYRLSRPLDLDAFKLRSTAEALQRDRHVMRGNGSYRTCGASRLGLVCRIGQIRSIVNDLIGKGLRGAGA